MIGVDNGNTGKGILFVVSSVSGGGKTTVINGLLDSLPGLRVSVSHTTRDPREGERDGVDYSFISRENFRRMIREGEFLEWAEVYGQYYGTSRTAVEEARGAGCDAILDIDVQGALQVRDRSPDAVLVFLLPPSMEEQVRRLEKRGTEAPKQLEKRLGAASEELASVSEYDYAVLNDDVREAVAALRSIVVSERCRTGRITPGGKSHGR
jgi:guanylate kinase